MVIFFYIIIFALFASLSSKIGVIYALSKEDISRKAIFPIISGVALGIMLGIAFLFLLPFSIQSAKSQGAWSFIGLFIFLAIDRFLNRPVQLSEDQDDKRPLIGAKILFCQGLINISYGVALSVGFSMGTMEGIILALGIILYQFPRSIHNMNQLKDYWNLRSAIIAAFLSPFIIPIGAGFSLLFLYAPFFPFSFTAPAYGITVGLFVYLGISDMIRRSDPCPSGIAFGMAAVAVLLLKNFYF